MSMARALASGLVLLLGFVPHGLGAQKKLKIIEYLVRGPSGGGPVSHEDMTKAVNDLGANMLSLNMIKGPDQLQELENILKTTTIDIRAAIGTGNNRLGKTQKDWAKYFAELSRAYPRLKMYRVDDLIPDKHPWFAPDEMKEILAVKNRINPNLKFVPTLYYDVRNGMQFWEEGNPYKQIFECAGFAYWAAYGPRKRDVDLAELEGYIARARQIVHPTPFISGIYPLRYGRCVKPGGPLRELFHEPETLRRMLELSLEGGDGVSLWGMPVWMCDTNSHFRRAEYQPMQNDDAGFDFKLGIARGGCHMGWYHAVTAKIPLPNEPDRRKTLAVSFSVRDNREKSDYTYKYFIKQCVVNDEVVWEANVQDDGTETVRVATSTDLPEGRFATVSIRLLGRLRGNEGASLYVKDIDVKIDDKPAAPDFAFNSGIVHLDKWMEMYNIVKTVFRKYGG
ncbi:MAG: hypothetical protein JXR37_22995 [Kiritimatiellae bacterium]|nr:hypothetical protein [Kiritimatiellia bacterium]